MLLALTAGHGQAEDLRDAAAGQEVAGTASDFGGMGLLEIRNARFRPDGTVEFGASWRRQRQFYSINAQVLPFLETTFRYAERLNATLGHGTTSDRAFDMKLRLWPEGDWRPALAVGAQDVIGTGLYGGEYLVASKRFGALDVSLGMGWGRLGTGADLRNPLAALSDRFLTRPRDVGQGGVANLKSLFRGRDAALFAGVEYRLPALPTPWGGVEGLVGKLEYAGDALRDERGGYPQYSDGRSGGLRGRAASRVNIGLGWENSWGSAGIAFVHGSDLLLRLSLRLNAQDPPSLFGGAEPLWGMMPPRPPPPAQPAPDSGSGPYPASQTRPSAEPQVPLPESVVNGTSIRAAQAEAAGLRSAPWALSKTPDTVSSDAAGNAPWGDAFAAARHGRRLRMAAGMQGDAAVVERGLGAMIQTETQRLAPSVFAALRRGGFTPYGFGQQGAEAVVDLAGGPYRTLAQVSGRVMRLLQPILPPGMERVVLVWRRNGLVIGRVVLLRAAFEQAARGQGSAEEIWAATQVLPAISLRPGSAASESVARESVAAPGLVWSWGLEPRLALQFGDPGGHTLWQLGAALGGRVELGGGFALAGALQQVVAGNLDKGAPSDSLLPHVRTDYARYARAGKTSFPALYLERLWNPAPDWFARASAGLLEPMFAGFSTELLWRPVQRPYGVGLDLNYVAQRSFDGMPGLRDYRVATGHLSLYADLPWWNTYAVLRAGRYLAGDWGGTIEFGRRFESGIEIGGFATFTSVPFRRFGEGSFDKGLYIRFPLELLGRASAAVAQAVIRPVQRDGGQRLAVDNPLWEASRAGRAVAVEEGFRRFLQ